MLALGWRSQPVVHGAEAAECGLACITMIARYHGHDVDLNGMRQRFPPSLAGATLRSMVDVAGRMGFATRALRADVDSLRALRTPAILHWDLNHFVVLRAVRRDRAVVDDPALGRRVLTTAELSKHFTGVVLEMVPTAEMAPVTAKATTRLRDLWSRIEGFWPAFGQVLGLSLALQVAVFAAPFYLQLTIDEAIQRGDAALMTVLALGFGGLAVVQVGITALRAWALQSMGFLMSFQIIGNVVHHLLRLRTDFFEKRHVGDILSRVESVRPIQEAVTQGVVTTLIDGLMAVVAAVILFVYSPPLASFVLGTVALGLVVTFVFYPAQRLRTEDRIVAAAKAHTHLIESVRASTVVKLMGREAEREGLWRNLYADVANASFAVGRLSIGMSAGQGLISGLQTIIVVYLAAGQILAGDGFSVGMLFAFLSYRQTFTDRSLALINQLVQFSYLRLHLARIGDVVHAQRDDPEVSADLPWPVRGGIGLRRLSFRYGSADPFVLDGVDMGIAPGSFVALTGPSGGGKTTLLKLMIGLYVPVGGEILLDGSVATRASWPGWRKYVGVVAQDDQLLSGTIADNIAFFDPELDMAKVQRAAAAARIHDDIVKMPMQYLSIVGDMGAALSGGQRQRILLARALYREPKVLFLDEGTANLDDETESAIVELISALPITRVVVAHRPALIDAADEVFWVGDGQVRQVGSRRSRHAAG